MATAKGKIEEIDKIYGKLLTKVGEVNVTTNRTLYNDEGRMPNPSEVVKLTTQLKEFKEYLICSLCKKLGYEILLPKAADCMHVICNDCEKRDLKSICPKKVPCTKYGKSYIFRLYVESYTSLCEGLLLDVNMRPFIIEAANVDPTIDWLAFVELIKEGCVVEDDYKMKVAAATATATTSTYSRNTTKVQTYPGKKRTVTPENSSESEEKESSTIDKEPEQPDTELLDYKESESVLRTFEENDEEEEEEEEEEKVSQGSVLVTSKRPPVSSSTKDGTDTIEELRQLYYPPPSQRDWPDPDKILEFSSGSCNFFSQMDFGKDQISSAVDLSSSACSPSGIVGSVVRAVDGGAKKLKVRLPKNPSPPKVRKGCRCGNAAAAPGKLTCCGQRCPCYVENKACVDCKCKGCRNPHLSDGKKLLPGFNAVIDTKTNSTVQLSSRSNLFQNSDTLHQGQYFHLGPLGRSGSYLTPYPCLGPLGQPVKQIKDEPDS